jgi:hypothetical protein
MKNLFLMSVVGLGLSGCAMVQNVSDRFTRKPAEAAAPADPFVQAAPDVSTTSLAPETAAPPPPPSATTVEALDTTTPEQRAAAAAPATVPNKALGKTVVSLGSPTEPGLWLKTPLVKQEAQGRVTNPATGKSSLVTLLPLPGEATAGSRMSLSALRLIGASLTDLTEVEVALEG